MIHGDYSPNCYMHICQYKSNGYVTAEAAALLLLLDKMMKQWYIPMGYFLLIVRWLSVKISLYIYRADKSINFGLHVPEVKTDDNKRGALVRLHNPEPY